MQEDIILIIGCLLVGAGALRVLSLIIDKRSPLRGIFLIIIGLAGIYYVYSTNEKELTFQDFPAAVYRIIGKLT